MNLQEILEKHEAWLKGEPGGEKAHLMGANLKDADLRGAILRGANLTDADLTHADLWGANLMRADLTDAYLTHANLRGADLMHADLEGANLTHADLRYADLRYADLEGANLQGSYLWSTVGNGKEIKSAQFEIWNITWTHDRLQIGCENHAIEEWWEFTDEQISEMDPYALEWWGRNKDFIKQMITQYPATSTKGD